MQQARTNFLHCTRPCKVPVSNNIWLLSLLCDDLLSMGSGRRGGRNELQWIVFWAQLRVPADCGLGVGCFGLRVLLQVLCRTVRARDEYRALRTGGSRWRARRLVASQ